MAKIYRNNGTFCGGTKNNIQIIAFHVVTVNIQIIIHKNMLMDAVNEIFTHICQSKYSGLLWLYIEICSVLL